MPSDQKRRRISRREFVAGSAMVLGGSVLAACGAPAPTAAPTAVPAKPTTAPVAPTAVPAKTGGRVVLGTVGDLSSLDPFYMSFNNYPMMENVYDQFARLDNQVKPSPAIMTEWSTSADNLKLTLKLRQGVQYHDGGTVTPDDVVKVIKRALVAETGSHQFTNWQNATDAVASGNDAVVVTFKQPTAYIISALGFMSMLKPSLFDTLKGKEGGTGAFIAKEWVPNDYLELTKFPNYWNKGKPMLDSARIKFFADQPTMVSALEAGTIDLAMSLPFSESTRLASKLTVLKAQEAANFYYFAMNTKNPPFDKKEVRQAIAWAIDKDAICKNVLFGISSPIDLPWPKFSLAYDAKYEGMYKYDLDEAKKRLAAAGYPNGIEFTLPSSNAVPETGQMGQIVAASLAKIGCKVTLAPMDTTAYNSMVQAGTFQSNISIAGGTQWFPTRIAASSLYRFVNNTCWPNGTPPKAWIDGLNATDAQLDPAKQKEAVKPAVASFMDEMWSLPIAFRFTLYGLSEEHQQLLLRCLRPAASGRRHQGLGHLVHRGAGNGTGPPLPGRRHDRRANHSGVCLGRVHCAAAASGHTGHRPRLHHRLRHDPPDPRRPGDRHAGHRRQPPADRGRAQEDGAGPAHRRAVCHLGGQHAARRLWQVLRQRLSREPADPQEAPRHRGALRRRPAGGDGLVLPSWDPVGPQERQVGRPRDHPLQQPGPGHPELLAGHPADPALCHAAQVAAALGVYVHPRRTPPRASKYIIMPALTLGIFISAVWARFIKSSILETMNQDYVRTARSKGLPQNVVVTRHVLRNALIPVITVFGLNFGSLLGGAVITEAIFDWPGVGRLLVQSLLTRDYSIVQALIMMSVLVYLLVNLITDLLYGIVDPRISRT